MLLDEKRLQEQGYFNAKPIRTIWNEFLKGTAASQFHVWEILMFEAWCDDMRQAPAKETCAYANS